MVQISKRVTLYEIFTRELILLPFFEAQECSLFSNSFFVRHKQLHK